MEVAPLSYLDDHLIAELTDSRIPAVFYDVGTATRTISNIRVNYHRGIEQITLDLAPFMVILGPNVSGKSYLFDAVHLLSRLAALDLRSAVSGLHGEPQELFRRQTTGEPGTSRSQETS